MLAEYKKVSIPGRLEMIYTVPLRSLVSFAHCFTSVGHVPESTILLEIRHSPSRRQVRYFE